MPILTERIVTRAKPREVKYELTCAGLTGFLVRVLPSGRKSYYVRYRTGGRDVRERIGTTLEISFTAARSFASARLATLGSRAPEHSAPPRVTRKERALLATSPPAPASPPRPPTLHEFAARFLSEHVDVRLKKSTRYNYALIMRTKILPAFGHLRLHQLERVQVIQWHAKMRDAPYEANSALLVLSSLYGRAKEWDVLNASFTPPTAYVRKFPGKSRERFLTPDERVRLEAEFDRAVARRHNEPGALRWESVTAFRLLAYTGMRRAEACDLTWEMVDWRHRCLRLPDSKTGKKTVPLSSVALELLQTCRDRADKREQPSAYVIPSRTGGRVMPSTLTSTWVRLRRRLPGLESVRLHDLRHSAASDAINAGVPLAVVSKILGHRKPSTTARYAHISDHALAEGVNMMGQAIAENSRRKGSRKKK
jgi:integrase